MKYEALTGNSVTQVGLIIKNGLPWLGASPDGVVLDQGEPILLEIKAPYSCKDSNVNVDYIRDGELKRAHPYYMQLQLTMFCCNVSRAHFFIYSPHDHKLLNVNFDKTFC